MNYKQWVVISIALFSLTITIGCVGKAPEFIEKIMVTNQLPASGPNTQPKSLQLKPLESGTQQTETDKAVILNKTVSKDQPQKDQPQEVSGTSLGMQVSGTAAKDKGTLPKTAIESDKSSIDKAFASTQISKPTSLKKPAKKEDGDSQSTLR